MDSSNGRGGSLPRTVGYVALWTDKPETLRDFFVTVFRYGVAHEDESVIVFEMEGETDLIIQRVDGETAHLNGSTRFGIYAEGVDGLTKALRQRGATFVEEALDLGEGQALTIVRTPTGHQVEIVGSVTMGEE